MKLFKSSKALSLRGRRAYTSISQKEKYLFDLNGFVVVRKALSESELVEISEAIDQQAGFVERNTDMTRNTKSDSPLRGAGGTRNDCGGILSWPRPHCLPFRKLLAHPKLIPYLNTFLGQGYRLDHSPFLISQSAGSEGFHLHGGPVMENGNLNPFLLFRSQAPNYVWTSLVNMSVALSPHHDTGGLCLLRGSHKSTFPVPEEITHGADDAFTEHVYNPRLDAGDVIFFSEATVHGALPWTAPIERRTILYRFSPAGFAYGRAYYPEWAETSDCTPEERAVLLPPYHNRLDRSLLDVKDGVVHLETNSRSSAKKEFDRRIFGTDYF